MFVVAGVMILSPGGFHPFVNHDSSSHACNNTPGLFNNKPEAEANFYQPPPDDECT
jgi:hypothetical protein